MRDVDNLFLLQFLYKNGRLGRDLQIDYGHMEVTAYPRTPIQLATTMSSAAQTSRVLCKLGSSYLFLWRNSSLRLSV